jgi:hypothetical protein
LKHAPDASGVMASVNRIRMNRVCNGQFFKQESTMTTMTQTDKVLYTAKVHIDVVISLV